MLTFFIIKNQEIKSYFKDNAIISVLKNWLINSKASDIDMMTQTYKLLMYALYQDSSSVIEKREHLNIKNAE